MAAKKLSAISIATALILIASFAAALLPQVISPQSAQAATTQQVFNSSQTWTVPANVSSVQVLVVAGGGGGGDNTVADERGGGGGAGGLIYNTSYSVTPGANITVTVGAGGYGGNKSNSRVGQNGSNSVFGSLTAIGGGGGGGGDTVLNGSSGGSGGGGVGRNSGAYDGGNGAVGQGNRGGKGYSVGSASTNSGGGGGAGGVGVNGSSGKGGDGGVGLNYSAVFGTGVGEGGWFAGGGGGSTGNSSATAFGAGGLGGGGRGGNNSAGVNALVNTGGGGGGSTSGGGATGGNGGSGIVIIRYVPSYTLTTNTGGNGTVTTPGIGTYTYSEGTVVNISATPNSCYRFVNWSGNTGAIANVSAASTTITMNGSYSIQANFAIITYTLSVSANNSGGSPYFDGAGPFNCGSNVTIHANTSPTYIFAGWTSTAGIANASAENTTVTMSQNRVLTANYLSAIPSIGTVSLWTTGTSPAATTSITPQSELNIKIPVSENRSFNYLVTLKAILYYDSDGIYNASEVPVSGNTQTCAILTWNRSTNTLTIDPGSSSTWAVNNSSSVFPSLSSTSGTFEFHFKAGKVATYTTGAAKWHIYIKVTDSFPYTGNGTLQNLSMNWYGEIIINSAGVDWGNVTANLDFNDSSPSRHTNISMTYICNGVYNVQVKSATTWNGNSTTAILKPEGDPGTNQFSLKADYDNTLNGSVLVPAVYATFRSGTQTGEVGVTESNNSLWLKLGTPFVTGQYNGSIYYRIAP